MPEVSEIKKNEETGEFYVEITGKKGFSRRVLCEDRKSIEEYRAEVLAIIEQKKQRGR